MYRKQTQRKHHYKVKIWIENNNGELNTKSRYHTESQKKKEKKKKRSE